MRKMVHICMWMTVSVLMLSALSVSCTKVKFSEAVPSMESVEVEKSHMSEIFFEVDWRSLGLTDSETPEDMLVIMSRLQNVTMHYVWHISRYGTIIIPGEEGPGDDSFTEGEMSLSSAGTRADGADSESGDQQGDGSEEGSGEGDQEPGNETEPGTGTEPEPEPEPEPEEDDRLKMYHGLYSVMAVAAADNEDFVVPMVDRFPDSLALRMRDLYVQIPEISEAEKEEKTYMDFNPVYPFIRTVGPLYFVRSEQATHQQISPLSDNVIRLSPITMTRKITFTVNAEVEQGVSVDRMVGVISGVPGSAQFMSGYVNKKNLCKMPFEMTKSAESGTQYTGSVNVFGLFPADSPDMITGPGIFNVILHASVTENEKVRNRVFHASINLKNTIGDADIMVMADDRIHYEFSEMDDLTINIPDVLEVTKEKILTGTDQGFEVWQENDTSDDEGLNPEI